MYARGEQIEERVGRPLELEDGNPPGIWSAILYSVCSISLALVLWSSLAEIREVATTKGELVPDGQIKTVSHYEGGIVEEIFVRKGDTIKKGQPIVRLHSKLVASELNRLKARLLWLELEEVRLRAEINQYTPDFSKFPAEASSLVKVQQSSYDANVANIKKTIYAIDKRTEERRREIAAIEHELKNLQNVLVTRKESFNIQRKLVRRGHTSQKEFLERKAILQRAQTSIAVARIKLAETKRELVDDIHERARKLAEDLKTNTGLLAKVTEEKIELHHLLEKHEDQYERLHIRAPISGIMKDVIPTARGAVIQSGKPVAEIVPTDAQLIAEVKIQPKDIGHIRVGDKAELTVTTYDFNVYGKLEGKLSKLSASSFRDNDGEPYYLGEISLQGSNKTTYSKELDLMSGMLVEANVVTGSKSILKYILKPIYRSLDVAFSER